MSDTSMEVMEWDIGMRQEEVAQAWTYWNGILEWDSSLPSHGSTET